MAAPNEQHKASFFVLLQSSGHVFLPNDALLCDICVYCPLYRKMYIFFPCFLPFLVSQVKNSNNSFSFTLFLSKTDECVPPPPPILEPLVDESSPTRSVGIKSVFCTCWSSHSPLKTYESQGVQFSTLALFSDTEKCSRLLLMLACHRGADFPPAY